MITVREMCDWLENHEKECTYSAVEKIYNEWYEAKKDMIEKFRKHPNWDENAMAIVLKESQYNRGFDKKAIGQFNSWCYAQIDKILEKMMHNLEVDSLEDSIYAIGNIISRYNSELKRTFSRFGINPLVNGEPMIMALEDMQRSLIEERAKYLRVRGYEVEKDLAKKYQKVITALSVMKEANDFLMTEELASRINAIIDVKAVSGQKISKVIRKICAYIGLNEVKDMRPYRGLNGVETMKDYGFNREYAILTDQINPIQYKRITVISLNPLDYWSMSHGYKWTSCHHVGDDEDGCYSNGTESYMLDNTSLIYYIIDEDYKGTEFFSQPKQKRCVFCIEEEGDLILESRVYPDGRDGGDDTLASQFRTLMQKIVSEVYEKNNYWDLKKGKQNCKDYTVTNGNHYPDYHYYNDCNISVNKDLREAKKIKIGHDAICPICGKYHRNDYINCNNCDDGGITCDNCGYHIDEDDYIYCEDNECYYCCEDCANEAGVFYCRDDYEWHDEYHCFKDDYTNEYYSGDPEVEAEDGSKFASVDNAFNAEYDCDEDGYWYPIDELIYCEDEDIRVHEDTDYIRTEDDKFFSCESAANSYGYYEDIDGNWYSEDELRYCDDEDVYIHEDNAVYIEEDDKYFSSEEKAREYGYIKNEDGDWVKESEVA